MELQEIQSYTGSYLNVHIASTASCSETNSRPFGLYGASDSAGCLTYWSLEYGS